MKNIRRLATPRSTLFAAAVSLIEGESDPLARLCQLTDIFPSAPRADIQRTLKEAALHLAVFTETRSQMREELARTPPVYR